MSVIVSLHQMDGQFSQAKREWNANARAAPSGVQLESAKPLTQGKNVKS
jgi:hypothetical protein